MHWGLESATKADIPSGVPPKRRGSRHAVPKDPMSTPPAAPTIHARPAPRTVLIGIALIVLNSLMWACSDVAAQYLTATVPPVEVTWMRFLVHFILMLPLLARGARPTIRTATPGLQALRGVVSAASAVLFIVGLNVLPVADATAITFVSPFIMMALALVFLGERVGMRRWIAAAVGLSGVLLIVKPGTDAFHAAALLPFFAAACGGIANILTRVMAKDPPLVTMFYTGTVGTLVMTHLVPAPFPGTEGEWVAEAAAHFGGEIVLAQDLTSIEVPSS